MKVLSRTGLFGTPWIVAHQDSLSMGSSRQEYWRPFPSPGDLPNPGITTGSPELQEDSLPSESHCAYFLSHVRLFETLWTVVCQASLSMEILQARILEWVVMPSSRGPSQPKGSNPDLPHCRWILYHLNYQRRLWATLGIVYWWFLQ